MRLAILSHHEAADQAVMANVARYLLSGQPATIAHEDRPDVGVEVAPAAGPLLATVDPAPALDPVTAFAAPSSAVAAALPIAPAATTPPMPPAASGAAVPPVPPAAAPAAAAAPSSPAANAATDVRDSRGFPWDERIHTSTKTMNKDGTWRRARETPAELIAQVEAELRAKYNIPAEAAATPPAPPSPPAPPAAASPFAQGVAAAVEAGQPAAPATFGELMLWVTPKMTAGKLDNAGLQGVLQTYGIAKLPDLITHPDVAKLVPAIHQHLVATIGA